MIKQLETSMVESKKVAILVERFFGYAAKQKDFEGVYLAGGAVSSIFSGLNINDLDFYCESKEVADRFSAALIDVYGYKSACTTENAQTFHKHVGKRKREVQVITRFVGSPEEVLNTFDFTCVMGLWNFKEGKFYAHEHFLRDVARRRLVYSNKSQYPICALYRTKKYVERGYEFPGSTMVAISLAIHSLQINTYKDLKDQLLGIDTSMFKEITENMDINKKFEADEFVQDWFDVMESSSFGGVFAELDTKSEEED